MDSGQGGINDGLPAHTSMERVRVPNPALLTSRYENPGANQFSWLSSPKFTEGKDASDMFYSALVGAEGYPSIKEPKDRLNKNGPLAFGSASSHYGKYLHDNLFNNDNFKSKLEKFYKDPDSATADDVTGILGDIDKASFDTFMNSSDGQKTSMAHISLKDVGGGGARGLLSGWGMSTGLTQGPPSGDNAEGIALEGLGYVPWDADKTILSPDLNDIISGHGGEMYGNFTKASFATTGIASNFMSEFNSNKKQSSTFLAGQLTDLLTAIEGSGATGDLGTGLFNSVAEIVKEEEKDAAAQADALAVGIANDVVPNLDVFYATKANKKQAMLTSLGEYPGLKGAPYKVGRLPEYTGLRGADGVTDPRTGKQKKKIQKVTDVKRDSDSFDALFPYFKMLADDVMGIVSVGGITGATPDGGIQFDAQKIAGGVGEKTMKALWKWSSVPYENWYEGGIPDREAERLIGLFWNFKKVDTALRKMQGSTREAMTMANGTAPGMFDNLFKTTGVPNWLGGNDAPDRVDPMAGFATGGRVGSSANPKPKGTDTVPAMLTPGEFVMKKSAVDKYGTGFMRNINQGAHFSQGGEVSYFDDGGSVHASGMAMEGANWINSTLDAFTEAESSQDSSGYSDSPLTDWLRSQAVKLRDAKISSNAKTADRKRAEEELRLTQIHNRLRQERADAANQARHEKTNREMAKQRKGPAAGAFTGVEGAFGVSKEYEALGASHTYGEVAHYDEGLTDAEWARRHGAWGKVQQVAREAAAATKAEKQKKVLAEMAVLAKKKEDETKEWWAQKNAYDKKRQAEREAAPAKHAAWVREQKVKVASPGTSFYESMTPEEKTLNTTSREESEERGNRERESRAAADQLKGDDAPSQDAYIQQQERVDQGLPMFDKDAEFSEEYKNTLGDTSQSMGESERYQQAQLAAYAGKKVNIGNWLDDMSDKVAEAEAHQTSEVMTPEELERARKMREGQDERQLGGLDRGAGMRNARRNASDLMDGGLNYTMPFDIGQLVLSAAASGKDVGMKVLEQMGFGWILENLKGKEWNANKLGAGYVAGNVRVGEPLPDRLSNSGVGVYDFQNVFGTEAVDKFYPEFKKQQDPMSGEFIDLVTLSRGMGSDPTQASGKWIADQGKLFNYISGKVISNTLMGGNFGAPKKGTLEGIPLAAGTELTSGEMGTITDAAGLSTGVAYDPSWKSFSPGDQSGWPMKWLPLDLQDLATRLDTNQWLLSPVQQSQYRAAQIISQKNAISNGRNALMENLNENDGGAQRFASGGSVFTPRGTDTVPAMLTPGEFVMKKSAVDKYGTGFMRDINNGVQRFAKGGPVQYLKNGSHDPVAAQGGGGGGGFGDIVSSISDSLSAFTQAFTLFSGLSTMLSNTISSLADMNINHTISINGSLNIPGFSTRAIKKIVKNIAEELIESTDEKIKQAFKQRDSDNENKT